MKILKIFFIAFVILVLVVIAAAFIFVKAFDINRFKPQIVSMVSKAFNRQVDFERVGLGISLRQGISLRISNLVVVDDPEFQKGDFLVVKDISLAVDVLNYIRKKKVDVSGVFIDSPRLTIIRKKDGSINVQSMSQSGQGTTESAKPASIPAPLVLPAVLISSLNSENGFVTYIDYSMEPPLKIVVSDLNISVRNISLVDSFPFVIEGSVLSTKKNIHLEGKAQINLEKNEFTIFECKGATDLSEIAMERIPLEFPMAKGAVLPKSLKGKANLVLEKMSAGQKGLTDLMANILVTDASLQFNEIALPITDAQMNIKITKDDIIFDKIIAALGDGTIKGSGSIKDYLVKQDFSMTVNTDNLKLQDLIVQDKAPVKAEGIASSQILLKGQGFSPEALSSMVSGDAALSVSKVKLKDLNVLRTVLDKISIIPGLSEKIKTNLPERYKQKLTQTDTVLSDMKLPAKIINGRILIEETVLGADEFLFKGQTQVGFDSAFSLEGSFLIPEELSAAMVVAVPQLQYLLNENNLIFIPLKISGKASEMKFSVDAEYIGKRLLMNQAKNQLMKVIDKAMGKDEPDTELSRASGIWECDDADRAKYSAAHPEPRKSSA